MSGAAQEKTVSTSIHATAIVVNDCGIVIRGRSRAGKSSLALAVLALARERGTTAALIGDDRVMLSASANGLIVEGHPAIAGRIEDRGNGIIALPYQKTAVVRLIVDLAGPAVPGRPLCDIAPHIVLSSNRRLWIESSGISHLCFAVDQLLPQRAESVFRFVMVVQ